MSESLTPGTTIPRCAICGEPIEHAEPTVVTTASVLHVSCVEQSAAAA